MRHDLIASLIKFVLNRSNNMAKTEHHSFRAADPNSNYRSDIHVSRQKEMRNGSHVKHGYSNEFLDSDRVANVYFTSDVDAKSRISGLNEFYRINLNDVRRAGAHDLMMIWWWSF